ncbi:MAG: VPDSG-CTERM sorting domain-containing protein [Vicinamibacterales bacterium]
MKNLGIVLLLLGAYPMPALAVPVNVGTTIRLTDSYGDTGGGEFNADIGANGSVDFITFCVEKTEFINLPGNYIVTGISTTTVATSHTLTAEAAYLFALFTHNALPYYEYDNDPTGSRRRSANALQNAIWSLTGWTTSGDLGPPTGTSANQYLYYRDLAINASSTAKSNALSSVRILNLNYKNANGTAGGRAQDQLYYVPDGGTTAGLLSVTVTALCVLRRRFRQ